MRAKELRIGNYVNVFWWSGITGTYEKTLLKISLVCESHIRCQEDQASNFDEIEGVSLNEEWLLNFGFVKQTETAFTLTLKQFDISITNSVCAIETDEDVISLNHIEHVHQLQNIFFSLTGEDLTLKK